MAKKKNLKSLKLDEEITFTEDQPRGVKPRVESPDPSPYKEVSKVFCPRCDLLLLAYYEDDPLRLTLEEGDPNPFDDFNYCRKCGLRIDLSDFKRRYYVCHG